MIKEARIGANGLLNSARINNAERYRLSRIIFILGRIIKRTPEQDAALHDARMAYSARPLDFGGDVASSLTVKGRKAQTKVREESE